jgi:hypothetical protein
LSCEPAGAPRIYFFAHPMKIIQTPTKVFMMFEADRIFRIVYMDREHPEHPDGDWYGDSIGKWDGNTLVVDTTGTNDRTWLDPMGHPHSDQLHLVERFTRVDRDHLKLDITIEDPMAYSKPWGGQKIFQLEPASRRIEDRMCDPENRTEDVAEFVTSGEAPKGQK